MHLDLREPVSSGWKSCSWLWSWSCQYSEPFFYCLSNFCAQIWSQSERNVAPQQNLIRFPPSIMRRYCCWKKCASRDRVRVLVLYFRYYMLHFREPLLSGQLAQSRRWPLNRGLTVLSMRLTLPTIYQPSQQFQSNTPPGEGCVSHMKRLGMLVGHFCFDP